MHHEQLGSAPGFRVALDLRGVQAAGMVLAAGDSTGGPDNFHHGADQWLYVIEGRGEALVGPDADSRRRVELVPGMLLVIERGERHEIRNTGDGPLNTLNFYNPPAFDAQGNAVGAGTGGDGAG